jgi:hypothetical protein
VDPLTPPRLPSVDAPTAGPSPRPSRVPPLGAVVAAVVLLGALALLVAAVAGIPPFTAQVAPATPSSAATASPAGSSRGSASPVASPSPLSQAQVLDVLAGIERRMVEIRQLPAAPGVTPQLVSTDEASRLLIQDFHTENPPAFLADQTQLYRSLGLLDAKTELGAVFERFLSTQVLGFYRSTDKNLYVISDKAFGPLQEFTAAHEYTHALQDARYGLDKLQGSGHDEGDLALARLSLIEGDATLAMTQWAIQDLTPDELSQLLAEAQDPVAQQALAESPPIVRETQTFPYSTGLEFIQRAWLQGGWTAVDRLWENPPSTTEQIIHPDKYTSSEKAIDVALPAGVAEALGPGWRLALQDTHGEAVTRIWLEQAMDPDSAAQAAAGWGGDRVGLYRGPNDAWAVAWETRWDSATEAREFATAAKTVVARLASAGVAGPGQPGVSSAGVEIFVTSDDQVRSKLLALLGLGPD